MITGSILVKNKLSLTAESKRGALTIRHGLAGKNKQVNLSPYGNIIEISQDGQALVILKQSGLAFTYEEIRTIVKKIQLFGAIGGEQADSLLEQARKLDARLTFFYPDAKTPGIEVAFFYNWASIALESQEMDKLYPEIREVIAEENAPAIKVFSNNTDVISIHNFSMQGISLGRKAFEGIADVLTGHGLINPVDRLKFVTRAAAFGLRCMIYMESWQQSKALNEQFSIEKDPSYNPATGDRKFLATFSALLDRLAETGTFTGLEPNQVKALHALLANMQTLDKYELCPALKNAISALIQNFSEEIIYAVRGLK